VNESKFDCPAPHWIVTMWLPADGSVAGTVGTLGTGPVTPWLGDEVVAPAGIGADGENVLAILGERFPDVFDEENEIRARSSYGARTSMRACGHRCVQRFATAPDRLAATAACNASRRRSEQ